MLTRRAALLLFLALPAPQKAPHIDGVGNWDIVLTMDPRTDKKTVALTSAGVIVELSSKGNPVLVSAREHNCRGRPLIISVDQHRAVLLGEGGRRHIETVTKQLLSGKKATLAYYRRPCKEIQYLNVDLAGFAATLERARHLSALELDSLQEQILEAREADEQRQAEARIVENPSAELLLAARQGNVVHVIASLDAGAEVNIQSETNGYTPLMWAASRGHAETVRLLLEAGADVNLKATDGQTALMRAADNGHADIVQVLLDAGAEVGAETDRGITALLLAQLKHHAEIVELLKKAGASK